MSKNHVEKYSLYDAAVVIHQRSDCSRVAKYLVVVGQSSKMLIYNTRSGKKVRQVAVCKNGIHALKCCVNESGTLVAVAS
ncbi:hypothetical protein Ciccas_013389 [Cichlidogyrus casuarinus]|uniref:Uncharacterized protein n=1 Tax=Cichlidogyrus casuarinus TaxID=1844966 RepID=A0ABD2PLY4_9PLAT